ncbi:MAG: ribosomal-processing cysteine protease Prp [Oscillospiraceae bacterium]
MVIAEFVFLNDNIKIFKVKGHANYDSYGKDIVCSAVTSAVQLTANGITEILKLNCLIEVEEDIIQIILDDDNLEKAQCFMKALHLHLNVLTEDYGDNIQLVNLEG